MKQEIYNYLLGELYPLPQCSTCQYSNPKYTRVPCGKCEGWNKYKFHKGHASDLKQLTKGIIKIINKHYDNRNKIQRRG